jgi:hypothetical protein
VQVLGGSISVGPTVRYNKKLLNVTQLTTGRVRLAQSSSTSASTQSQARDQTVNPLITVSQGTTGPILRGTVIEAAAACPTKTGPRLV